MQDACTSTLLSILSETVPELFHQNLLVWHQEEAVNTEAFLCKITDTLCIN